MLWYLICPFAHLILSVWTPKEIIRTPRLKDSTKHKVYIEINCDQAVLIKN